MVDLYVIAERSMLDSDAAWLEALSQLAALDVEGLGIQVRAKSEPPLRAEALAREAREATRGSRAPVLLNGTSETARTLGYDGVHWPEASIPGSREAGLLLRGASVHSAAACRAAEAAAADLLVAGAIFDAGSKSATGSGLDALRTMARATHLPVLAIGGIRPDRVAECIAAGASGVAVVSAVLRAADMEAAIRELRDALDESLAVGRTR